MAGLDDFQSGKIDTGVWVRPTQDLITGTTKPRIRVDVGQTGFFEKREFETYREFATPTTDTFVLRVVSPINFILLSLGLEIEAGSAQLRTYSSGTPTGTFSETMPYIPANTMSETPPAYSPQIVLTAIPSGGSLSGGSQIRVARVKAADNSNFSQSVGATPDQVSGRAAGTYYATLTMTSFVGVLTARFEERP